jgi:nucleoside-diphosphate-sugar epimerase
MTPMAGGNAPALAGRVLVTGANGYVGLPLCRRLAAAGYRVRAAVRSADRAAGLPAGVEARVVGEHGPDTPWHEAIADVAAIVHLAAGTSDAVPGAPLLERCRAVNVESSRALASAAAEAGVPRVLYVSSIKVNGERTPRERPYTESDVPAPEDAYGQSKWEAEQMLWSIAAAHGLQLTVLRPPIVYGPHAKGNFLALLNAVRRGLPLPLASIDNLRSLIYIGNLVDAIAACLEAPAAAGRTYLVSDGEDVSTPELIRRVAAALGVPARLLPCPPALLGFGARLLGRNEVWRRLGGSLRVDSARIRAELGWTPPYSMREGLEETAKWYLGRAPSNE